GIHENQADIDKLREENEILRTAISHIDLSVFVYDKSSKVLRFVDGKTPPLALPSLVSDPLHYLNTQKIVAPEYAEELRNLFARNRAGEEKANVTIKTRLDQNTNDYRWYNIVLANRVYDANNSLLVIGTMQDVTERVTSELRYSKEEQFRMAMMTDNRRVYEINVTHDRFMRLESMNDSTDCDAWTPYTKTMSEICRTQVYKEDWPTFLAVATRGNLLDAFANGKSEFYCEYRLVDDKGNLSWSSSTTHLLLDPVSGEIKGFIYAKDIDSRKKQELLLRQQAERDPLTGVYNRAAAENAIEEVLTKSNSDNLHGFLSIDIDDFKTVNDTFGHVQGDVLLQQIANGFSKILRTNDTLARMGGDEFIVFINDINSIERIRSIATRLCEYVHTLRLKDIEEIHFSISVGVATYPENGTTFAELYKYSDAALYYAKQHGKNRVSNVF
ncbi:MAG: GGDEF domain-containing protein, partial [Angelakisella sp.]